VDAAKRALTKAKMRRRPVCQMKVFHFFPLAYPALTGLEGYVNVISIFTGGICLENLPMDYL
jgi:hypothetical protein